jgi:hypothetical protein
MYMFYLVLVFLDWLIFIGGKCSREVGISPTPINNYKNNNKIINYGYFFYVIDPPTA